MRNDTEPEPVGRKRTIRQSVPVYVDAKGVKGGQGGVKGVKKS